MQLFHNFLQWLERKGQSTATPDEVAAAPTDRVGLSEEQKRLLQQPVSARVDRVLWDIEREKAAAERRERESRATKEPNNSQGQDEDWII